LRRYFVFMLLTFAAVVTLGCAKKPAAVVNGEEISEALLQWNLNQSMKDHRASGSKVGEKTIRDQMLQQLIAEKLIYLGAKGKGLTVDDHDLTVEMHRITDRIGQEKFERSLQEASLTKEAFTEVIRQRLVAEKFVATFANAADITEDEIKAFYQASPTPFLMPERVRVRLIQTSTEEQAEGILKELAGGKDFDKLADDIKAKGEATVSSYSWANPAMFSPAIASALKDMKAGAYDGPFKSGAGYYIFRVDERESERPMTLEEAADQIRKIILEQRRQLAVVNWLMAERTRAEIVIN
jgi:foldase protein PrsA